MLIEVIDLNHRPICTSILMGHVVDSKHLSLYKINFSHLDSPNFHSFVHQVCNLVLSLLGIEVGCCGGKLLL